MKRAIACFITAWGLAYFPPNLKAQADQIQLTPQQQEMQRKADDRLKNHPFDFYGIILDESGKPVAGAKVVVLVQGELGSAQGSTKHDLQSDQEGRFKLEGIHSFGVIVTVSKDGYYTLPTKHDGPWFWIIRDDEMPTTWLGSRVFFIQTYPLEKK